MNHGIEIRWLSEKGQKESVLVGVTPEEAVELFSELKKQALVFVGGHKEVHISVAREKMQEYILNECYYEFRALDVDRAILMGMTQIIALMQPLMERILQRE